VSAAWSEGRAATAHTKAKSGASQARRGETAGVRCEEAATERVGPGREKRSII
jgi:hypothetical protein